MAIFAYNSSRLIIVLSFLSVHAISTAATVAMETDKVDTALKPVANTPVEEKDVALKPVANTPVEQMGVALKPVANTPVEEKGVALKPVANTPVEEKGVAPKPTKNDAVLIWCGKTDQRGQCEMIVKRDPREVLKASPEGIVTILLDAAQHNAAHTTKFIHRAEKEVRDKEVAKAFNNCVGAYGTIGNGLKLTPSQLSNTATRNEAADSLIKLEDGVSYHCEWFKPYPMPPHLQKMFQKVDDFVHIVQIAAQILKHM